MNEGEEGTDFGAGGEDWGASRGKE